MHREDELHGAAEDAAGGDLVDRERAAQQHAAVVTSDGDRDELAGLRLLGDAGRDDRHREVGPDLLDGEHLSLDLHRRHDASSAELSAAAVAPAAAGADRSAWPRAARMVRWCSCSGATPISPARSASMPCTAAASACTVVRHGTPRTTAAVRMS